MRRFFKLCRNLLLFLVALAIILVRVTRYNTAWYAVGDLDWPHFSDSTAVMAAGYNVACISLGNLQQPQVVAGSVGVFHEALDWLVVRGHAAEPIIVLGLSQGVELAVRYPQIDNLICTPLLSLPILGWISTVRLLFLSLMVV